MNSVVGLRDVFVVAPHHDSFFESAGMNNSWHGQHLNTKSVLETASIFGGSGGGVTCQDCGNQAKKDCGHKRCRTCCKSRGFDCSTHVRSTWVPAARRRERMMSAGGNGVGMVGSNSGVKKMRVCTQQAANSNNSNSNCTRSFDTAGSSHQDASFRENLPGQVRAPAIFKCVQVTSIDDEGEDEYAYQAMVKIGGHVFKGFLYDQGEDDNNNSDTSKTTNNAIPNLSELHLGGGGSTSGHADMTGLLGGTNYGNPIN